MEDDSRSLGESGDGHESAGEGAFGRGGGIRSSWRGGRIAADRAKPGKVDTVLEQQGGEGDDNISQGSSKGKGKMVDIGLEDTLRSDLEHIDRDEPPDDLMDEDPPVVQHFVKKPSPGKGAFAMDNSFTMPHETEREALLRHPGPPSSTGSIVPPTVAGPNPEPPKHDAFWGSLYLICLAALFSSWFLVWLHTSPPTSKKPLGDTIYSTLHASFHLLAVYTVISVLLSLVWIAALRNYVRPLVVGLLVAVPVILYSFALYPFISSFKGTWHGNSFQDKALRWGSFVPAAMATLWIVCVVKGRHSAGKAVNILEFACRILSANSALLGLGFASLAATVVWTWLWILMFTRVFLGGHTNLARHFFIIDVGTWWLGVFFVMVYLWTLGMIAGVQRAVTGATVSQWYFHRLAIPAPTSRQIVQAAVTHALSTLFGTISLFTLLALLIRLPLLLLPKRLSGFITMGMYTLIPTPIAALTNPLTLTYASIHSVPLATSARGLSQMTFLAPSATMMALNPRTFSRSPANAHASTLLPYRLAKLLLHATRFIMSLALGFGGWVSTARSLHLAGQAVGIKGSLYAYVVGFIAGAIGWGILGAMEGVLAGVVDAVVVCWGSEVGASAGREARYCREAGWLFGGDETAGHGEAEAYARV